MRALLLSFLATAILFSSCGGDDDSPQSNLSGEEQLQQFFTANNITPQQTPSGLYFVIDEMGDESIRPTSSSTVLIDYHGYFLNGDVFDSSVDRGTPLEISLLRVIEGWREGVPLFGQGGSGSLYIPASLAYGSRGQGTIPPNTPIAFDIELLGVR